IDQNIDTSTSTGRLMFNMLASIAEFENDLRTERQAEGIAKAKENGVKFGRPAKLNEQISDAIHSRRTEG
ncbi:recombinase family protein, partial [Vibrio parahaemolyticus]